MKKSRLIELHFVVSNESVMQGFISAGMKKKFVNSKHYVKTGGKVLSETLNNSDISKLLSTLDEANYLLVDAFYELKEDENVPYSKKRYILRFFFVQKKHFNSLTGEMHKFLVQMSQILNIICSSSNWNTLAFENPFYNEGSIMGDEKAVCIYMSKRKPKFSLDGTPLKERKLEDGMRVGDPLPITGNQYIGVSGDGRVKFLKVS